MLTTKQTTNNDWLLSDLTQILDYCVQEGEYEEAGVIEGIIREARPIRCTDDHLCRCPRCNGNPTDGQIATEIRRDIARIEARISTTTDGIVLSSLEHSLEVARRDLTDLLEG